MLSTLLESSSTRKVNPQRQDPTTQPIHEYQSPGTVHPPSFPNPHQPTANANPISPPPLSSYYPLPLLQPEPVLELHTHHPATTTPTTAIAPAFLHTVTHTHPSAQIPHQIIPIRPSTKHKPCPQPNERQNPPVRAPPLLRAVLRRRRVVRRRLRFCSL